MPNLASGKKELRKNKTRKERNLKTKEALKKLSKKCVKAIEVKDQSAKEMLLKTLKAFDKAAQKGVIKKNTRDRKKSRLHNKLNQSLKK